MSDKKHLNIAMNFSQLCILQSEEEKWEKAHDMLRQIGGNHILVSGVRKSDRQIKWLRTSMFQEWISEYVHEDYYDIDPIINERLWNLGPSTVNCGSFKLGRETHCRAEYGLNNGLKDAGYGVLSSQSFQGKDKNTSLFVTLCFDRHDAINNSDTLEQVSWLKSYFSYLIGDVPTPSSEGIMPLGAYSLSQRERDVLSFLAAGHKTSRIAEKLGVADVTISKHLANARRKTKTTTREQTVAFAIACGVISI